MLISIGSTVFTPTAIRANAVGDDPDPRAYIFGPKELIPENEQATYTFSIGGAPLQINAIRLKIRIENKYFIGGDVAVGSGWGVNESPDGWIATTGWKDDPDNPGTHSILEVSMVRLFKMEGGELVREPLSDNLYDVFKAVLKITDGIPLGGDDAKVEIVEIIAATPAGLINIPLVDELEDPDAPGNYYYTTSIFSRYDVNRNKVVDEDDAAIAFSFFRKKQVDSGWGVFETMVEGYSSPERCDVNDIGVKNGFGDGHVNILDILEILANFS